MRNLAAMDRSTRLLMQIRVVMVVYRTEAREARAHPSTRARVHMAALLDRSLELLAVAESQLDGQFAVDPELAVALGTARRELRSSAA